MGAIFKEGVAMVRNLSRTLPPTACWIENEGDKVGKGGVGRARRAVREGEKARNLRESRW